jgi:hypothetical protein
MGRNQILTPCTYKRKDGEAISEIVYGDTVYTIYSHFSQLQDTLTLQQISYELAAWKHMQHLDAEPEKTIIEIQAI